jgi:branched-chain amino acid transport system substrate-binding protein
MSRASYNVARIGALLLALVVLAGLPGRAAEEPYELYAIVSLTGPAAFAGRGAQTVFGAIERLVNTTGGIKGHPLRIVVQDDQSNPANAVQIANQIFARHVPIFIGPGFGATCTAVLPLVANGPVMFCLSNVIHPPNGSFAFSALPSTKDFTAVAFRWFKAKGIHKLALLTSTDASGQDGEQVAVEDLRLPEFRDLQLVANEHFSVGDLTVAAQMSRIKAAGAEAIDAWTTGTPFGTVLRGVAESSWDGIVMTNAGNMSKAQMEQYAQIIPRQMILTAAPFFAVGQAPARVRLARTTYLDALHQSNVAEPDNTTLTSWDPTMIVVDALRHLGTNATAVQMRDYLLRLHDFPAINGVYDFRRGDQRGIDPRGSVLVRWDKANHEFVTITKPGGLPFQ